MQGDLQQQRDFLVAQPIRPRGLDARPRPIADALQFFPLHRQNDFGGPGIDVDDLELRADERVQEPRRRLRIDAGGAADDQLLLEKVVGRLVRRGVPRRRHRHFAVDTSDPVETLEIEADRLRVPVLYQQHAPHHEGDDGAVPGRGIGDVIGRRETAGSRHVLHDDGRRARDMLTEVARHQTRLSVVAAARAGADDESDLPAGVEFGNRLRRGASCGEQCCGREQKRDPVHRASRSIHARTLPRPRVTNAARMLARHNPGPAAGWRFYPRGSIFSETRAPAPFPDGSERGPPWASKRWAISGFAPRTWATGRATAKTSSACSASTRAARASPSAWMIASSASWSTPTAGRASASSAGRSPTPRR